MGSSFERLRRATERPAGKYRVLAEVGEGGMANVYLAIARGPGGFNKLVVLKAIRESLAFEAELLAMFLDEAKLARRLSHPNIVQTLEVGELRGRPVIVMEYLDGVSLSNVLHDSGARELGQAMRVQMVTAALGGLQYIHELADYDGTPLELVHRDVSPHNIFVTFDGQVKLLDFGIAKGLLSSRRTRTDVIKGKVRYMAPEQMCGEVVDRRADLFSVGVILWEIATGQPIWHGRSEVNVMHAVLHEGVPAPIAFNRSVSPQLNDICVKALAKDPTDRYQSATELQAALDDLLAQMGAHTTPKQISDYLCEAFADSRERTKRVIEAELSKADETHESDSGRFTFPTRLVSLVPARGSTTATPIVTNKPAWRVWMGLLFALAFGTLVSAVLFRSAASELRPRGALASPALPDPAGRAVAEAAASAPAVVHVRIGATPASAVLSLDGKPLGSNPFDGSLHADTTKHTLRAEAQGYLAGTADIALDSDVKVVLTLAPKRAMVVRRPAVAVTPSVVPTAPMAAPVPGIDGNCAPPFYFDAQGIKRLKLECL